MHIVRERCVCVGVAVAPIAQRRIPLDPHRIDIHIRPQRIEVKESIVRAVLRLMAKIFRPIRGVSQLRA